VSHGYVSILTAYNSCSGCSILLPAQRLKRLPQEQKAQKQQHCTETPCCAALGAAVLCVLVSVLQIRRDLVGKSKGSQRLTNGACLRASSSVLMSYAALLRAPLCSVSLSASCTCIRCCNFMSMCLEASISFWQDAILDAATYISHQASLRKRLRQKAIRLSLRNRRIVHRPGYELLL